MKLLARWTAALAAVGFCAFPVPLLAHDPTPFVPAARAADVIRTWGHGSRQADFIGPLVRAWEKGFQARATRMRFETTLWGDKSAIGGLYTGAADLALMERTLSAIDKDSYEQIFERVDPFTVAVATGSYDVANRAPALVVFVHPDNPIAQLTLAQLDAIFGAEHRRGARNIRTWGELGLTGEWASKPIHGHAFGIASDPGQFFQEAVMGGSQQWMGNLREYGGARQIVEGLAGDRYGIALADGTAKGANVKPVALAAKDDGLFVAASRETVARRIYPLTRTVFAYVNRSGKLPDAQLLEYLRYIVGPEGQAEVARDGGYFPLSPELAEGERRKLQ